MIRYEERNGNKERTESKFQVKSRRIGIKPLICYYLRRVINSLTILQGIMTFCFLIFYFQNVINFDIIVFYLYFTIIIFIVYSFMIFGIHFLEKPEVKKNIDKSTQILEDFTEIKPEITEEFLQGKTLQVYWYFFTKRHAGVREIQKALKISSSGTVSYQITKLLKAGIISKNDEEGKYSIKEDLKIGILRFFIRIGNRTMPRISLYLIIYSFGFITFLILAIIQGINFFSDLLNMILLFFLIIGTIIFIVESFKIRKLKPI
ncbi:MAG: hypothetical protein ACFE9S_13230 [Candidatus Hermodarchaeota archaeon]